MMPHTVHIPRTAPWLPASLRNQPGEIRYTFRFSAAEHKIFRRGRKIRPSRWCEMHRVVTMSRFPGKWKNDVTPYLASIMDASFYPSVRRIIICASPQTGKSEAVRNCLAVAIDQWPGPAILVYPDEKTSDDNNDKFRKMVQASPRLRSYMTGLSDDMTRSRISLIHLPIYFGWARSAASMADKPCRYAVNDETDKYTDSHRETSAILQTENRLATYANTEKHWLLSSPTIPSGPIWTNFTAAQVRFDYYVSCPFCGEMQKMEFGWIKWPHKTEPGADGKCHSEDADTIEADRLAWYECPHCLAHWNDYDRDLAVLHGQWRDRVTGMEIGAYLKQSEPARIAFHIPSWLSRFVSLSKPAASFLRSLGRTAEALEERKNFHNKHMAEPWSTIIVSRKDDEILAARCDLPPQTAPEAAVMLSAGVDVQLHGFWFAVRAWAANMTSWLIHYGFLATWEDLERLLFETSYPVHEGGDRTLRIYRACVDTGGSKKFEDMTMTEETYFWLIKNRGRSGCALHGSKGSSSAMPGMLSLGNGIVSTPAGKRLPGMLKLIMVDTVKAKDQYHYRLGLALNPDTRGLPGAGFLHRDTGLDYVHQILAEEKQEDEKGREVWVNPHNRPNHLLDADILAAVCVEMEFPGGGLRLLANNASAPAPHKGRRVISQGVSAYGE